MSAMMRNKDAVQAAIDAWSSVDAGTFNFNGGIPAALRAFLASQDREALTEACALAVHGVTCKRDCGVADGEDYRRARAAVDVLLGDAA